MKKKDLNTLPTMRRAGQKYKSHDTFHFKKNGVKIIGKEDDTYVCKTCNRNLPSIAFNLMRACRECESTLRSERRIVNKNAPPKPDHCECCHRKIKNLWVDHQHGSFIFRGWLCSYCNTGMGKLGDNLEGIAQAAIFLENDINKIIETLHKVYDEMFARINEKKF
jgi:DNA-directed RNA polymerase subunit RPC12/RpoP